MRSRITSNLTSSLAVNGYLIMSIRLTSSLTSFIFWALAARLVRAENIGLASSAISASVLIAGLAQFGYGYGLVRFLPGSDRPSRLINLAFETAALAGLVLSISFILSLQYLSPALLPLRANLWSSFSFASLSITSSLGMVLNWSFMARRKFLYSLFYLSLGSVLAIIFLIVFSPFSTGALSLFHAYSLSSLLSLMIAFALFMRKSEPGYRFTFEVPDFHRSTLNTYLLSSFFTDQFQKGSHTFLAILVLNMLGAERGAYFFLTWSICIGLISLMGGFSTSLFVEGSNDPQKTNQYLVASLRLGAVFSIALTLVVGAFSKIILGLYGAEYILNASTLFVLLLISILPGILTYIFLAYLRIRANSRLLVLFAGFDFCSAMTASFICLSFYGLIGVGYGWLISRLVMMISGFVIWKINQEQSDRNPLVSGYAN